MLILVLRIYFATTPQLDVWAEPRRLGLPVDVHVSSEERESVVSFFEDLGLKHKPFIHDLHR